MELSSVVRRNLSSSIFSKNRMTQRVAPRNLSVLGNTVNFLFNIIMAEAKGSVLPMDQGSNDVIELDNDVVFAEPGSPTKMKRKENKGGNELDGLLKQSDDALAKLEEVLGDSTASSTPSRQSHRPKVKAGKGDRGGKDETGNSKTGSISNLTSLNSGAKTGVDGKGNGKNKGGNTKGKRNRSINNSSDSSPSGQGAKKKLAGEGDKSFRDTLVQSLARVLVDNKQPSRTMSKVEMDHLASQLQRCVMNELEHGGKPKIEATTQNDGRFTVHCADQYTCEWLARIVTSGKLEPFKEVTFAVQGVTDEDQHKMKTWVLDYEGLSWHKFKDTIAKQNDHLPLKTQTWRYHTHIRKGEGWLIYFGVGTDSLKALETMHFRPYYVDRRIVIHKVEERRQNNRNNNNHNKKNFK